MEMVVKKDKVKEEAKRERPDNLPDLDVLKFNLQ